MPDVVTNPTQPSVIQPALAQMREAQQTPAPDPLAGLSGMQPDPMHALSGLGEPSASAATAPTQPNPHRTLNTVLKGVAYALAGAAGGMGAKTPGAAAAEGLKTGIGLHQQEVENTQHQAQLDLQKKESQSRITFQSAQSAEATARAAMYDKQLHQMDTEFQDTHNARTLDQMKELQAMGVTPTIVTPNHGEGATAALQQLTDSHGGVPHMFILNLGDKLVGYDLAGLNGMSNMRDQVNKIAEIQGKGKEAYNAAVWGPMSPEAKNNLIQQSLSFFNPMPTKENVGTLVQQYKNWREGYVMNPAADKDTVKKLDGTIKFLQESQRSFDQHDINKAVQTAAAEAPVRISTAAGEEQARLNVQLHSAGSATQAQMLVDGQMDPTQMSKRASMYNAIVEQANQYSMAKYGKPFDIAKAQEDYKFANNPATQNTLKYLNSLTGNPVAGTKGNLDLLIEKSNKIKRTDFPALNNAAAWARLETGNPDIVELKNVAIDAADQFAKIMSGGGSGSATSDAKIKQGLEMFQTGFSKKQMVASANSTKEMLENRKRELIGDNRYLVKQYSPKTDQPGTQANGMVLIKASDGSTHQVPANKLDAARQIDPKLQVINDPADQTPQKPPLTLNQPIVTPK